MEQRIKDRYNDAILQEAMRRYDVKEDQIQLLDGFESYMYEFARGADSYILRIGHSIRRNAGLIQGEVHWINYLADGGAGVAKAILSEDGNLVEHIDDNQGGHFLATAFVKAKGGPPWEQPNWNTPPVFERYGRLIGRIHALSRSYQVPDPAWKRPQWDDEIMLDVERWLPESESVTIEKFQQVMAHLRALPKTRVSYGLIHFDAHPANFFMDAEGTITLFDFDDCNYSWYINEIAIILFYNAMGPKNNPTFTQEFLTNFLHGYQQETPLDLTWLKEIPWFLKLREIDLYAIIHRSFDLDNLDDDPWAARFMEGRKERIEDDLPVIDFGFESLAMSI